MEAKLYNQAGKAVGKVAVPEVLSATPWNADLVHQVTVAVAANRRAGTADSKGRGEVRGGGKKPWRQKGTGRSRHGSIRSPLWRGGGATHGPLAERNYTRKVNKRMYARALATVVAQKLRDGEVLFVDKFALAAAKTKEATKSLAALAKIEGFEKLGYKKGNRVLISLPAADAAVTRSFRNLPSVMIEEARNTSPSSLLQYHYMLVVNPEASLPILEKRVQ